MLLLDVVVLGFHLAVDVPHKRDPQSGMLEPPETCIFLRALLPPPRMHYTYLAGGSTLGLGGTGLRM